MQALGGHGDFGAEAKLAAVGEAGAGVPVDRGGVDAF
jgi:hypothetical protein